MRHITTAALLVTILTVSTQAQSVYSAYWRVAPSSASSGNGVQLGGGGDILYDSGSLLLDVDVSYVREAKLYVGDGSSFRSQGEALVRIGKGVYAGGGMAAGVHVNSQYTKAQYQPLASVHYRPSAIRIESSATVAATGRRSRPAKTSAGDSSRKSSTRTSLSRRAADATNPALLCSAWVFQESVSRR